MSSGLIILIGFIISAILMLIVWLVSKNIQKKCRKKVEADSQKAEIISIIDEAVSNGSNIKSTPRLFQGTPQLGLPKWGKWLMGFAWLPFIVAIVITVSLSHNNNSGTFKQNVYTLTTSVNTTEQLS